MSQLSKMDETHTLNSEAGIFDKHHTRQFPMAKQINMKTARHFKYSLLYHCYASAASIVQFRTPKMVSAFTSHWRQNMICNATITPLRKVPLPVFCKCLQCTQLEKVVMLQMPFKFKEEILSGY